VFDRTLISNDLHYYCKQLSLSDEKKEVQSSWVEVKKAIGSHWNTLT